MFVEKVDSDTLERETVNHTFLDITALVHSPDHQQPRPHPNGHHEHEDSLQFNKSEIVKGELLEHRLFQLCGTEEMSLNRL